MGCMLSYTESETEIDQSGCLQKKKAAHATAQKKGLEKCYNSGVIQVS